eukprot:scaffold637_cov173-Skeletonema_marinoi.AAC.7
MPPSPPHPPVVHVGKKSPTAGAASSASVDSTSTAQFDDNQATTNSVSSFLHWKTFVQKIHVLLEVPKYSSIISWNDAGTAVIIHDVDAFISTIVPTHFKQSKFGSFIRKMRRWGFSVITKKHSTSRTSTSSERGQSAVMEFSSEHFLRDQPELCLLMKDERHVKTQFSFLDRTVRKANGRGQDVKQGSSVGVCVHSPRTSSNANSAENKSESQQLSAGVGGLNTTMNSCYPRNHAHANSVPPMITPHQQQESVHNAVPMMNMMMPPLPQFPPYGYGAPPLPPQAPGLGFGPSSPPFQPPSAPNIYSPYPYQQQQPLEQQNQQQRTPPQADCENLSAKSSKRVLATDFAASATPNGCSDPAASTASGTAAVLLTSSEESTTELLPSEGHDPSDQTVFWDQAIF